MPAVTTTTFAVTGMHCGSCAGLIDDELNDLTGVVSAKTSAESGRTVVERDPAVISETTIQDAISSAGEFTAQVISAKTS